MTGDVTPLFLACDRDSGSLEPENGNAHWENWHYLFSIGLRT
jgi:hypothetical protein